jgi:predicted  nucleic acid-binding Zn-ribbon protein
MSIRLQSEVSALEARVKTQGDAIVEVAYDLGELTKRVEELAASVLELQRLLQALSRAPVGRGKAA